MGSFVASGAVSEANNASVTPALPAGLTAGDLLVVFAAIRNSGTGTVNTPAGYTLLLDMSNARVFGKIAAAGEAAPTVSFTGGVANATTQGVCAAWRNIPLTALTSAVQLNASAQNIAYPALAGITALRALVLTVGWKQDDWTSVAALAGAAEISDAGTLTGDDQGIVWDYALPADGTTSASSGSFVVTGGAAAISRGGQIAFNASPQIAVAEQDVWPPRVLISVTGLLVGDEVQLYRSVAGALTEVRAGHDAAVDDTSFLRIDAELPFGVPVHYVAEVGGVQYASSPVSYTLTGGKVALSDAIQGLAAEVVILAEPERAYERQSAVFKVGGRNVAVLGPAGMFTSELELYVETTAASDALQNVLELATEGIVQIRQPGGYDGVDAYIAVTGYTKKRFSQDGSDDRRTWVLAAVETEAWAEALEAEGYTLQDIADVYTGLTLDDISDDFATLLAIAQGEFIP